MRFIKFNGSPRTFGIRANEFKYPITYLSRKDGYVVARVKIYGSGHVLRLLHRVLIEMYLNVSLTDVQANVHHIDSNRANNHISNLLLMSNEDHHRYHDFVLQGRWGRANAYLVKWKAINRFLRIKVLLRGLLVKAAPRTLDLSPVKA